MIGDEGAAAVAVTRRRRTIAVIGVVALALIASAVIVARSRGTDTERLAADGPAAVTTSTTTADGDPTTTVPLVPLTTGVPIPDAVEAPPATEAPSATPASPRAASAGTSVGTEVTAAGAVLTRSPSGATRRVDKAKGCTSATADGWTIEDCGALRTSGTVLVWLVEAKGKASRALVLKEQTAGRWLIVLSAADVDGRSFTRIGVRGEDVSGDGQPELVFGFHRRDDASTLAVDVVDGAPSVVAHTDLAKGSARVAAGALTTWSSATDGFDEVEIRHAGGAYRASAARRVPASAVPQSMI